MTLLLCVLALSYLGSTLMRGRALRGFGLPSGSEWVVLGFLLGPHVLGSVDRSRVVGFEPLAAMAVSWMAFIMGTRYARGVRSAGVRAALFGTLLALCTAGAVAGCVYFVAQRWLPLRGVDLLTASLGAGLVSAETTRYAIGWVVERYAARGPLSERIAGLAAADDAVPLLLLAVPFALLAPNAPYAVAWWGWSLATLALGALLGMTSALLLRFAASASDSFGVLLGAALLGSGIAWRLGLSALTAMFALGATLAVFSRHRDELTSLLTRTEQPVLLPALLLAGAALNLDIHAGTGIVLGVACGARMLVRVLAAPLVGAVADPSRRPGPVLGLALLPTGGLTITLGLACTLRFPGAVGDLILSIAVAQTLLGELLGPLGLRSALRRAGEITEAPRGVDAELAA